MLLPWALLTHLWRLLHPGFEPAPSILPREVIDDLDRIRDAWDVAGLAVALVLAPNGTRGWHDETLSFGRARDGVDVDADSLFSLASNSKLFTAAALGLLIENATATPAGSLAWDTRLVNVLPDWGLADAFASAEANLVDLLSMRSGLPRHDYSHTVNATQSTAVRLQHLAPSCAFRTTWQYNNAHYLVLSDLVSRLAAPLPAYIAAHVLGPLGMGTTTYDAAGARASGNRTDSYVRVGKDATACRASWETGRVNRTACRGLRRGIGWWTQGDGLGEAGAGGVISSARDMTKWLRELLSPRVLPSSFIARASTPLTIASPHAHLGVQAYGLAQFIGTYRGHSIVYHTGALAGQTSLVLRVPGAGIALAVLTNDDEAGAHDAVAYRLLDSLLGLDPVDWTTALQREQACRPLERAERPKHPVPPSVPPREVQGVYVHAAYPHLDLRVIDNVADADARRAPALRSPLDAAFASEIVLEHFDGDVWNWTLISEYHSDHDHDDCGHADDYADAGREGGQGSTPVRVVAQQGSALVLADGIGMYGDFWGAAPDVPRRWPGEGRVRAEVWFDKV
ncbi:hypothetical protein Q5752_006072 [Cryptotrichosporon argae]